LTDKTAIRTAAKAIVVHDGQLLLTRARLGDEDWYLLPGGGQWPGEALDDTVRREVLEETGLKVRVLRLLWLREYIAAHHEDAWVASGDHRIEAIFLCEPETDTAEPPTPIKPDESQQDVAWHPLSAVSDLPLLPKTVRELLREDLTQSETRYLGDVP
jgi:8-oxo-dGTP diphosphatase